MRLKPLLAWGASIALGVTGVLFGYQQPAIELKVGDVAPAFRLQGSDGKTYTLADFKGKSAVVLAWFPKAFTGG
jgi:peroxiredoxin Q/BCP